MLSQKVLEKAGTQLGQRYFRCFGHRLQKNESPPKYSERLKRKTDAIIGETPYRPTNFERWLLVYMKKYPKGQVPEMVSEREIYNLKNRARIHGVNYLMGVSVICFIYAIVSGKMARSRGETLMEKGLETNKARYAKLAESKTE